ncbi:MAG: hypothetical protein M1533_04150 [Candidatus Thermoplasmatota archaeon]|nr:hypothetical protein [Candidatus Thermoplasmatota archaeon]MCL5793264.1 hypothetical protein [Candidatus Thermoplasmatota archaeon]
MNRSRYFNEESFHEWLERSRSGSWDNIVESGGRNLYSFSAKVVGETAFQL